MSIFELSIILFTTCSKSTFSERSKRSSQQPISLSVELLIVTDLSIFNDHRRFLNSTNNTDIIFLNMKVYFAQYVNAVNTQTKTNKSWLEKIVVF